MAKFQSTRPVRGATGVGGEEIMKLIVSIHAPRAGRDVNGFHGFPFTKGFNPRAPCGARQGWMRL